MKKYERESLLKSFSLFFLLLTAIYFLFAYGNYRDRQRELEGKVLNEMRIFSFNPTDGSFDVDFVEAGFRSGLKRLHRDADRVYAFFEIPGSEHYLMKVSLPLSQYRKRLEREFRRSFSGWVLYLVLIGVVSFLLAIYALHPLKKALEINEEFVKDILHDINTPLSVLRVNLAMLKKRVGEDRSIERMLYSLETIQAFQSNLRAFLDRECGKKERFDLKELLENRIDYFRQIYPDVTYRLEIQGPLRVECNREAMVRILENLLSNAGRYNVPKGSVSIRREGTKLVIEDTGIGIREPEKVFERFYKEGERGLGLGLHIVKKLTESLGVGIDLKSRPGQGTSVFLDLAKVISR